MFGAQAGIGRGFRQSIVGLVAVATVLTVATDVADARRHRRPVAGAAAQASHRLSHHAIRDNSYSPPYAAIVVDANTGKTLEESNPDSLRHPASLTKIMTLYLLFERLDSGKMKLGTMLPVSEHASGQAPTKLGLRPGQRIAVEDAIRGIVTRSANDAAVVVAEAIGGDEEAFAQMMTSKARALGMSRTTYVNASGLPDDDQVTTARDQALLGRAIQEKFPLYYTYFSTPSFVYRGEEIRNHNHLLGRVEGVDGIKTGYTRASGFNLVTSVKRNNRHIVAVVLGGSSAGARDARMRDLIEQHIAEASTRRTATAIAEAVEPLQRAPAHPAPAAAPGNGYSLASASSVPAPAPAVAAQAPIAVAAKPRTAIGSSEPIKPIAVKTIKVKLVPVQTASLAPAAAMIPVDETGSTAQPSPLAAEPSPKPATPPVPAAPPARAPEPVSVAAPATPAVAPAAVPTVPAHPPVQVAKVEAPEPPPPTRSLPVQAQVRTPMQAPAHVQLHKGWIVQIGAYESENEARQHLDAAQSKAKALLGRADRFTETVTKGDKTLYRARFAGLEKSQAEATCRQLKRSDMVCMTVKN